MSGMPLCTQVQALLDMCVVPPSPVCVNVCCVVIVVLTGMS